MWRGGGRLNISVSAPFVFRNLADACLVLVHRQLQLAHDFAQVLDKAAAQLALRWKGGALSAANMGKGLGDDCGRTAVFNIVCNQFSPQSLVESEFPTSSDQHGGTA